MATDSESIRRLIAEQRLPRAYEVEVSRWHVPIAGAIGCARHRAGGAIVVGLCGPQGSGKTTLARFLALLLEAEQPGRRVVVLSLDDFYLPRAAREALAAAVHPLLRTRGVPGTHDVALAIDIVRRLRTASAGAVTVLPRFDKAADAPANPESWRHIGGSADIVIFEGWCVGARPQSDSQLIEPVNRLEAEEDGGGAWRRFVNERLACEYQNLFAPIAFQILLSPPDFECVHRWRGLQERKLRAASPDGTATMNKSQLARFIMHYERLSRHVQAEMPGRADLVVDIDRRHRIVGLAGADHSRKSLTPVDFRHDSG